MTPLHALLLGLLQGLTEFLPVSSSGHLVLAESLLGLSVSSTDMLGFDILLHAGTLAALLLCYAPKWKHILLSPFTNDKPHQKLFILLILATIPAALAGVLLEDWIAETFRSMQAVAIALFVTAAVLIVSERVPAKEHMGSLTPLRALWIGLGQMFAIIPGISRSGSTIGVGRFAGLSRREALDFSFLMAVPIIAGATVLTGKNILSGDIVLPELKIVIIGIVTSFLISTFAILFLRRFVVQHSLSWFALYLIPLGFIVLVFG